MTHKTLIKFFFGISIISLILWNRFLRERNPIELQNSILNPTRLCIIILLIVMFGFIIYINIKVIFNIQKKSFILKNIYIKQAFLILKEYITNAPEFLYRMITKKKDYDLFLEEFAYKRTYENPKKIIIYAIIIPQIIIATIFVIEIIFFHRIHYFFLSLNLLLLVLGTKFLRFIMEVFSSRRAYLLEQYLDIEKVEKQKGELGFYIKYKKILPVKQEFSILINDKLSPLLSKKTKYPRISLILPELQTKEQMPLIINDKMLHLLFGCWYKYRWISDYMEQSKELNDKYACYVQIYTSLCYILGWSFYLFIVLNN